MATVPPAVGPPALVPAAPLGLLLWHELYDSAAHVFPALVIPYALLLATFFHSVDPPETLLTKLKRTSLESPMMMALVSDEAPDTISLLKNPCRYVSSLLNPLILDGMVYGFTGPDGQNLTAVNIPASAFKTTMAYNVLDDLVMVRAGLEALPADQTFHPYVNVGMPMAGCTKWMDIIAIRSISTLTVKSI